VVQNNIVIIIHNIPKSNQPKSNEGQVRAHAINRFVGHTSARIFRISHPKQGGVPIARVCVVSRQRVLQGVLFAEPAHAGTVPVPQRRGGHASARIQGAVRLPVHLTNPTTHRKNHNKQMQMYYITYLLIIHHFFQRNGNPVKKTGVQGH
jgi:hypothetical protein